MNGFETVTETQWGAKKVRHCLLATVSISYPKPAKLITELPLRAAGSVIPFALGNIAGQVLEYTPVVDQYTSSSTHMLIGMLVAGYGFFRSGVKLNEDMEIAGAHIGPFPIKFNKDQTIEY